MCRSTCVLTVFMGLFSFSAFAEDKVPDDRWLLAKYDANGDRAISAVEIEHKRQRVFAHMDENADGDVSFDEYKSLDSRKRDILLQARFSKLDSDQDGRLSGQEYASYLGSFDRLDQNGDGQLTATEMKSTTKFTDKSDSRITKSEADVCLLWVCVRKSLK